MQKSLVLSLIVVATQAIGASSSAPKAIPSPTAVQPKPGEAKKADVSHQASKAQTKPGAAPLEPAAHLTKLADAIQRQYNQTRSATFDFEQTYIHPFLSGENSKGDVSYDKSSGNMMWNYREPKERQKKFFISGNKFTYYSIADKIAYTHDCYQKDTLSASLAFLSGTGNLKESFKIVAFDGKPPADPTRAPAEALSWLSLIPKEQNAPVKKISFGATADGKVFESIVEDPSGGKNHFKIINFKINPKIPANVFIFKAPMGIVVQPMPNVSCPAPKAVAPSAPTKATAPVPHKK